MSKYLRIPFDESEVERINDQLSLKEQKQAIVRAFNDSFDEQEVNPEDIESYDTMKEIDEAEEAGVITPSKAEQLRIKGRRSGLVRL